MDLPGCVLRELHDLVPVAIEAILGDRSLHLLRVEEVEVSAVKFTLQGLLFSVNCIFLILDASVCDLVKLYLTNDPL